MNPLLQLFLASAWLFADPATPREVTVPFELVNKTVFVRVTVNDHPLWFILDSGLKPALVDLAVARAVGLELGEPAAVTGAGSDSVTARFVRHGEVLVTGVPGASAPLAIALPLDRLAASSGHEIAGLLGTDFAAGWAITIDYARQRLTFRDTNGYAYRGAGEILPVTLNASGHPVVGGEVTDGAGAPKHVDLVLDIGNGAGLILNTPFVDASGLLAADRPTVPWLEGRGVGGEIAGVVGRIDALRLGRAVIQRPVTVFSRAGTGPLATADPQGDIGAGILERFTLTLDLGHGRVVLEPNAHFGEPTEYNRSGFTLRASGPDYRTFVVDGVRQDSPATEAGLQAGDTLVTIDGRPAGARTLSEVRLHLKDATVCRLRVVRGDVHLALTLRLRRAI